MKFGHAKTKPLVGAIGESDIRSLEQLKKFWFPDYAKVRKFVELKRKQPMPFPSVDNGQSNEKRRARTNKNDVRLRKVI